MTVTSTSKIEKLPIATWTIKDILAVISCILFGGGFFYLLLLFLFGDTKTTYRVAMYVALLLALFFPLFWLKKKYGLSKEVLGLRKGYLRVSSLVLIGVLSATIYSFLLWMTPLWLGFPVLAEMKASDYYIYLLLLPISIDGFTMLVLTPISEEILDRGFIYGYLRKNLGVVLGLTLQALFFSLSHFGFIYGDSFYLISNKFFIGLILGILYEITGSIYPTIICHSVVNYLVIILSISWK